MSQDPAARERIACRAWSVAVGKKVANHTRALRLVRGTLIVEVEDALWQRQLHTLRAQILARLGETAGPALVEDVEFRIGAPRRMPAREERGANPRAALWDEAEAIPDPALRRIYQNSRRKALA